MGFIILKIVRLNHSEMKLFLKYSCGSRPRYKMTKDAEQGD